MKLSNKQKEVIKLMREGVCFYFNPITNYKPYTKGDFGSLSQMIDGRILNKLEKKGFIEKTKTDRLIYLYRLTELSKTIEL